MSSKGNSGSLGDIVDVGGLLKMDTFDLDPEYLHLNTEQALSEMYMVNATDFLRLVDSSDKEYKIVRDGGDSYYVTDDYAIPFQRVEQLPDKLNDRMILEEYSSNNQSATNQYARALNWYFSEMYYNAMDRRNVTLPKKYTDRLDIIETIDITEL